MGNSKWKQIHSNLWVTMNNEAGIYGRIYSEKAEDGIIEYWYMTCISGDLSCEPIDTAMLTTIFEDACAIVETALEEEFHG